MEPIEEAPPKRGRGRPPGSLNKKGSRTRGYVADAADEPVSEINEAGAEEEATPPAEEEEAQSEPEVTLEPIAESEPEQVPEPENEPEPEPLPEPEAPAPKRRKVAKPKPPVAPSKPARKPRQPVREAPRVEPEPALTYAEALRRFHEDTTRLRLEERRNHYASFFA